MSPCSSSLSNVCRSLIVRCALDCTALEHHTHCYFSLKRFEQKVKFGYEFSNLIVNELPLHPSVLTSCQCSLWLLVTCSSKKKNKQLKQEGESDVEVEKKKKKKTKKTEKVKCISELICPRQWCSRLIWDVMNFLETQFTMLELASFSFFLGAVGKEGGRRARRLHKT